jgi:hypothetical protein
VHGGTANCSSRRKHRSPWKTQAFQRTPAGWLDCGRENSTERDGNSGLLRSSPQFGSGKEGGRSSFGSGTVPNGRGSVPAHCVSEPRPEGNPCGSRQWNFLDFRSSETQLPR